MRRVWSLHVFSTAICSFRLATSRFTTWLCFRNITALSCVTFLRFIPFTCGRKINWRYFTESPRVQLRSGEYFIEKVTSLNSSHLTGRALAKGTRKWMQVNASFRLAFNLRFVWTCASRALALTLVELKFVRKSTQVFHRLAIQRKSTQVTDHKSTVYDWNLRLFATCLNLWADLWIHLATHRKSVRKFWFRKLALTWVVDLPRIASPFGQGSSELNQVSQYATQTTTVEVSVSVS